MDTEMAVQTIIYSNIYQSGLLDILYKYLMFST